MAVISGIGGHIVKQPTGGGTETPLDCIRTWGINHSSDIKEAVCSSSQGGKVRIDGNTDWTGQYTAYGSLPAVLPGDLFQFNGAIVGDAGAAVGAKGEVICDQVQITIDIEGGTPINHQVNFGADGALTTGPITVAADTGIADLAKAAGMKVEIAPDPFSAFSQIHEVRSVQLTISRANLAYASSGTAGINRRIKGNLDATLSLTCFARDTDGWLSFPQPNSTYAVKIFTQLGPDEFWLLKWLMFSELGGMDVDIEGGGLVGVTAAAAFNAITKVSGTATVGVITKPGGGDIFP